MADSNTTKAKTFRTEGETADRVDAWMEKNGISNRDALKRMMDIIDMSEAKGSLAGRSTEIENFESLTRQLVTAYTASLDLAQNAEARIRDEFAKRIDSQDMTIADLQARAKQLQNEASVAKSLTNEAQQALGQLQTVYNNQSDDLAKQTAQTEKAEAEAQKAREQVDRLTTLTGDQADEIRSLKQEVTETAKLRQQVAELTAALDKERETAMQAAKQAEDKLAHELEKAQTRQTEAVLKAEKAGQDMLAKVRAEHQADISKMQADISEMQMKAQQAMDAAQAQGLRYQQMYKLLSDAAIKGVDKQKQSK